MWLHLNKLCKCCDFYMFLTLILQFSFTVGFMKVSGSSWITPLIKNVSVFQNLSDFSLARSPHQWIAPVYDYNVASDQPGMTAYTIQFLRHLQSDTNTMLNNVAWKSACQAGVALHGRTHRGCRAGAHTRRRFVQKQTGVNTTNLLTIKPVNEVHSAKLCLLNARSVCNKADFIIDYVADHDIDVLCITETWLQSDNNAAVSAITPHSLSTLLGVTSVEVGWVFFSEHHSLSTTRNFGQRHRLNVSICNYAATQFRLHYGCLLSTDRYHPAPNSQPFATFLTE